MKKQKSATLWDIFTRLFVATLVFSGIFLTVVWKVNMDGNRERAIETVRIMNKTATNQIDTYIADLVALSVLPNAQFKYFSALNSPMNDEDSLALIENFTSISFTNMYLKPSMSSFCLFNKAGKGLYSSRHAFEWMQLTGIEEGWYRETCESDGKANIIDRITGLDVRNDADKKIAFSVARKVFHLRDHDNYAVVVLNSDFSIFHKIFSTMRVHPEERMYLLGKNGNILYSANGNEIGYEFSEICSNETSGKEFSEVSINGSDFFYLEESCNQGEWKLVNLLPQEYIAANVMWLTSANLIFCTCLVLFCLLIILAVRRHLLSPIKRLTAQIGLGNLQNRRININYRRNDEIGALVENYNRYMARIEDLAVKESDAKLKRQQLEFQILQEQINPHFLYNTLESIRMLALANSDHEVAEITYSLGAVTRYTTSRANQMVSLEDDLKIVEQYLKIQKTCYGQRFETKIEIEEGLEKKQILKFLIQPVVENAIVHGMSQMMQDGSIVISVHRVKKEVHIEIRDNGCGIPPEALYKLRCDLADEHAERARIGLYNVNNRLRLYYGADYGLKIESTVGAGTSVELTIPYL